MGKKDMVPGHENELWFTPTEEGVFLGQCAEFCGLSHAKMRFRVYVHSQEDYDTWVAEQLEPATPSDDAAVQAGEQQFLASGCVSCHTVRGNDLAVGQIGPDLTHIASRDTIAGSWLLNTPENMADWLRDPSATKPGSLMPNLNLTNEQIQNLSAYLYSLE